MKVKCRTRLPSAAIFIVAVLLSSTVFGRSVVKNRARIYIVMVWDGLRPDLVNGRDTPNLFLLEHEGVLFGHHHAAFPTITMVNAAVLSTGGNPGHTGILDDSMYFGPFLAAGTKSQPHAAALTDSPVNLENSDNLATLNSSVALNGYLVGVEGIAQQVLRQGGYVAIIGKQGPTFLFDDEIDRRQSTPSDLLFVADDLARPELSAEMARAKPPMRLGDLQSVSDRDRWFAQILISQALPAARAASLKGRSALIVFWQHNPDLVQHVAGLGTQPALNALRECDANLGRIRTALARLGLVRRTDLMVVSDHGFATIRMSISLSDLLVGAGIKKSPTSRDIVVARNGGNDLVYLSREAYPSEEARRATLARIVDFAEAQEWCGPIFSSRPATQASTTNRQNRLGWIPGTFDQEALGIYSAHRAPDLIISFREITDVDNRGLTGPTNPAFVVGAHGQALRRNASFPLVTPVSGVIYADSRSMSTGQGTHGAAGAHELQAFCAAVGPDFRRHFNDPLPSGNQDIAPTIRQIFDLTTPTGAVGRVLQEALIPPGSTGPIHQEVLTSYLVLQGQEILTKLRLTNYEGREYIEDSYVTRTPLNGSP
jgi:hypothetical protein